jgi:SAM-dependent methyltransferase
LDNNNDYWDNIVTKNPQAQDYDSLLAEHYRKSHLDLISRWTALSTQQTILKTDLFAEAMCPSRSFMWEILRKSGRITGIDISPEICKKSKQNTGVFASGQSPVCISCDIRTLPFSTACFDLVISDSTLDHFKQKRDIEIALNEFTRVLKPGGTIIITMDNKTNFTEPLFRLWIILGLAPFFIGKTYSMDELRVAVRKTGLEIVDCNTLIHNPRFFTKLMVAVFRRVFPHKCDSWTKRSLKYFDSLGNQPTRYLTAQFIAIKAVKPLVPSIRNNQNR